MTLPLRVALDQCRRHVTIMQGALADMPATWNADAVAHDDLAVLRTVDQFVYRFIKLQDTLGEHVLRTFASQVLACLEELPFERDRVNPHGGAIALGHPIGCTGARILVTLLHGLALGGGKRGIATLCVSGGMGLAALVETV